MRSGLNFRAAPARAVGQRLRIRWDDLGRPTQPCTREYNGELIEVRQRDIQAADGNPNAVFTASRFRLWTGPAYYRLGEVEIPNAASSARHTSQPGGARHLRIKWEDLGSPSISGTVGYRGSVVDVQDKNIVAAKGNPQAIFTATQIRPYVGRAYYVLGQVEFPEVVSPEAKVA